MAPSARVAAIQNWWSSAQEDLGLRGAETLHFYDEPVMLKILAEQIGTEVDPLRQWLAEGKMSLVEGESQSQAWWAEKVVQVARTRLMDRASERDQVRLHHQKGLLSSGWMAVSPSMPNIESPTYRLLLQWHLGMPLIPEQWGGVPCPLQCGSVVDPFGDHIVACRKNRCWERHHAVQDYFCRCLLSAGIPHRREVSSIADKKRDADIFLPHWEGVTSLAIDVAVCHPAPLSLPNLSVEASDRILKDRATKKDNKYKATCSSAGTRFEPMVFSTWGSMGPGGESLWRELVRRLAASHRGSARSALMTDLLRGLSRSVMVGVGRQLHELMIARERGYVDDAGNEYPPVVDHNIALS